MELWSFSLSTTMTTLEYPVQLCAWTTLGCYVLSVITGNVSQVDRLWSLLPTVYAAYFALLPLWPQSPAFPLCPYNPNISLGDDFSPRALLMFSLTVSHYASIEMLSSTPLAVDLDFETHIQYLAQESLQLVLDTCSPPVSLLIQT